MLGSRGMRERRDQQGWITKLVFDPPLALRDVDNAFGPIPTVPTRLSTPRLLRPLLLFLSWMMVSSVKYPSFKTLDLRATRTFTKTLVAFLFLGSILIFREKLLVFVLPVFFTTYLIYGFIRPRISRKMRDEIEEEDEETSGGFH